MTSPIVCCGIVDTKTGCVIAKSTSKKHGLSARRLARELNALNAGPDYKYVGGHGYYRFSSFQFYHELTPTIDSAEYIALKKTALAFLRAEDERKKEEAIQARMNEIDGFDIPEEYKEILRNNFRD